MRNLSIIIVLFTTIIGGVALPFLPNEIVINWDNITTPSLYVNKYIGVFVVPILMVVNGIIHYVIVRMNKETVKSMNHHFFLLMMMIFFALIQFMIILSSLDVFRFYFDIITVIVGIILIAFAIPMRKVKRNALFGIRTTWSMKNDRVWQKSNELGSILFIIQGLLCIIFAFTIPPKFVGGTIIVSILMMGIIITYFSYRFAKEDKKKYPNSNLSDSDI